MSVNRQEAIFLHAQIEVGKTRAVSAYGLRLPSKAKGRFFFTEPSGEIWNAAFELSLQDGGYLKVDSIQISDLKLPSKFSGKFESLAELRESPEYMQYEIDRHEGREVSLFAPVEKWQLNRIYKNYTVLIYELTLLYLNLTPSLISKAPVNWRQGDENELTAIEEHYKVFMNRPRQSINIQLLKQVAQIYSRAARMGEKPVEAVQAAFKVSHRTASDYATKAREAGLLPKTTPGKVTVTKINKRKEGK